MFKSHLTINEEKIFKGLGFTEVPDTSPNNGEQEIKRLS